MNARTNTTANATTNTQASPAPYVPFGPEWEKEVMKLPKAAIVNLYRNAAKAASGIEAAPSLAVGPVQEGSSPPSTPRCVLASDGEGYFIACYDKGSWDNAHTGDPIDSVIVEWQELFTYVG